MIELVECICGCLWLNLVYLGKNTKKQGALWKTAKYDGTSTDEKSVIHLTHLEVELLSKVFLWEPKYRKQKRGKLTKTYVDQLRKDICLRNEEDHGK